jgi:hypothetical protein
MYAGVPEGCGHETRRENTIARTLTPRHELGSPISRTFFARGGIPQLYPPESS